MVAHTAECSKDARLEPSEWIGNFVDALMIKAKIENVGENQG
jgi:hypothetical protein